MPAGRSADAALMAACTSRAAASIGRLRSNWATIVVRPRRLVLVSSVTLAICPMRRSSGAATAVAIVWGSAPGRAAVTMIVGYSTRGRDATARKRNASAPLRNSASISRLTPTGRFRHVAKKPTTNSRSNFRLQSFPPSLRRLQGRPYPTTKLRLHPVEHYVDHWRRVERQELAEKQGADDGDPEWTAQLRPGPAAKRKRDRPEQSRHRRHHDRAKALERGIEDRLFGPHPKGPLGIKREVDHHDGVLLDDADEQDDGDHPHQRQVVAGDHERDQRPDASRRQGRQNRDRMNGALIEHPQHDVDRDHRRQDQPSLARERGLELGGLAGERSDHGFGHADGLLGLAHRLHRSAERDAWGGIK